jgi:hypothetical protein
MAIPEIKDEVAEKWRSVGAQGWDLFDGCGFLRRVISKPPTKPTASENGSRPS